MKEHVPLVSAGEVTGIKYPIFTIHDAQKDIGVSREDKVKQISSYLISMSTFGNRDLEGVNLLRIFAGNPESGTDCANCGAKNNGGKKCRVCDSPL